LITKSDLAVMTKMKAYLLKIKLMAYSNRLGTNRNEVRN